MTEIGTPNSHSKIPFMPPLANWGFASTALSARSARLKTLKNAPAGKWFRAARDGLGPLSRGGRKLRIGRNLRKGCDPKNARRSEVCFSISEALTLSRHVRLIRPSAFATKASGVCWFGGRSAPAPLADDRLAPPVGGAGSGPQGPGKRPQVSTVNDWRKQ